MIMYACFIVLVLLSAFFSGSETSLFSIGKVARNRLVQSKHKIDLLIAKRLESPRRLLVTILLGNEVTNVALSVVAASITQDALGTLSSLEQGIVSALLVVPILLIVGEITPKTLAAAKPELLARTFVGPLSIFALIVNPLVSCLEHLASRVVQRLSGQNELKPDDSDLEIAESEFRTLVDAGMRDGIVEAQERRMIHNVLDFGELTVGDVMQPWSDVITLKETTTIDVAVTTVIEHQFSRIPLWRNDPNTITGIILAKDLLMLKWKRRAARNLQSLRRVPLFTLPTRSATDLLTELKQRRFHIAVVVNESGKAIGICTMEDLLEELFGPITDTQASVNLTMEGGDE